VSWPEDLIKAIVEPVGPNSVQKKLAEERQRRAQYEPPKKPDLWPKRDPNKCYPPERTWNPNEPPLPRQPSVSPTQGSRLQNAIDTAKRLDHEFGIAELNGDRQRMHKILSEMAALMTSDGGGGGGGGDGHDHPHEPHSPADPGRALREQILAKATRTAPHLQHLTNEQLRALRAAPTPDAPAGVRFVIPPPTPRARK
jgi:hypothetical protein